MDVNPNNEAYRAGRDLMFIISLSLRTFVLGTVHVRGINQFGEATLFHTVPNFSGRRETAAGVLEIIT